MARSMLVLSTLVLILSACGGENSGGASSPPPSPAPTSSPSPTPSPTSPPPQATLTYLHSFQIDPHDGGQPNGPLLQARDGNFYGTTRAGGANLCRPPDNVPCGTIFKLTPEGDESVVYSFGASPTDGYSPTAPLIEAQDGALYGMTHSGGEYGGGTIFKIGLDGTYTIVHSFGASAEDGMAPTDGLVQAPDGTFYGATASGGANHCVQIPQAGNNCGTVFKMTPAGDVTILHSFGSSQMDGVLPNGSLLLGRDGNLYGTTQIGGAEDCIHLPYNCGTVFTITPSGKVTILHEFGRTVHDGLAPQGPLVLGGDGAFYGTTPSGGGGRCGGTYGCGTVFRVTPSGLESVIYTFATTSRENGDGPAPFLLLRNDGNFYGVTHSGGKFPADLNGTVFRLSPSGTLDVLYSFGPLNEQPSNPLGGLIQGTDGALYGVTNYNAGLGSNGTGNGSGTAFKLVLN